jgi:hypothetical protein
MKTYVIEKLIFGYWMHWRIVDETELDAALKEASQWGEEVRYGERPQVKLNHNQPL